MGSGCTKTNNSKNCANIYSSDCIKYMGSPNPIFGICTGDNTTEVYEVIIQKILEILSGNGINLEGIEKASCSYITQKLQLHPTNLVNVLKTVIDVLCTYRLSIDDIYKQINSGGSNVTFDLKCISLPAGKPSIELILQTVISAHCALSSQVTNLIQAAGSTTIINTIVNQLLNDLIKGLGPYGIKKQQTGDKVSYLLTGLIPPKVALPYFGSLSNFDNSGKGIPSAGYDGWFLCNGNNSTPDLRGVTLIGAIQGVGGPVLSANVDPVANNDSSLNYTIGQTGGTSKVALNTSQIPSHTHAVTDPGHSHIYSYPSPERFSGNKFDSANQNNRQSTSTNVAYTGITISPSGGNQPHENRMPFTSCAYIMRFD